MAKVVMNFDFWHLASAYVIVMWWFLMYFCSHIFKVPPTFSFTLSDNYGQVVLLNYMQVFSYSIKCHCYLFVYLTKYITNYNCD